ncbi:MAG: Rieske (2Fe-2S) protein [Candidatus Promineifilaceae bacterium]|nr:Rieske (2Fe-2S) protein [Candidatus Promineifilaceae bacterium]
MSFLHRNANAEPDRFYTTGLNASEVMESAMHVVRAGRDKVIVTRVRGELVAFSTICPHAAADLSKGRLRRGQIKCPDHGYLFDVVSGRAVWPEGEGCRLIRFAVREVDGEVQVRRGF